MPVETPSIMTRRKGVPRKKAITHEAHKNIEEEVGEMKFAGLGSPIGIILVIPAGISKNSTRLDPIIFGNSG